MHELAPVLSRLSVAVQFSMVTCLFGYFLLLGRMVKLREVKLWTLAWLANAAALAAVFVHVYASIPPYADRITLVLYLAGKAAFAVLVVAGARHHALPRFETRVSPLFLAALIALWSLGVGFGVPKLWQGQLAESTLVGATLLVGAVTVLRHPRSSISRWLGWAMLLEGILFLLSAALLVPGLWGNRIGVLYLSYSSFIDALAELMLALASIAVIADRREDHFHYVDGELLQAQGQLSDLVDTDPLTNLATRRSVRKMMESLIETGGVFVFIDINGLRKINDLFGHRVGNATLQRLARLIVEHFRPEDLIIRWGGDEFLVGAPEMALENATERVAAIRESAQRPFDDVPALSIAAGAAEILAGGDPTVALEEADGRMYAEKRER
jgi:diguanylate cyclase (GGDEF)-like protein